MCGEPGGRRVAVLTFDLHKSDLPLQAAKLHFLPDVQENLT